MLIGVSLGYPSVLRHVRDVSILCSQDREEEKITFVFILFLTYVLFGFSLEGMKEINAKYFPVS